MEVRLTAGLVCRGCVQVSATSCKRIQKQSKFIGAVGSLFVKVATMMDLPHCACGGESAVPGPHLLLHGAGPLHAGCSAGAPFLELPSTMLHEMSFFVRRTYFRCFSRAVSLL
jgi:hypothetical protein